MNAHDRNITRELPINLEAEQALLGALLMRPDGLAAVAGTLRPEHFAEPLHARIFDVAVTMSSAGRLPTPVSVRDFLPDDIKVGDDNRDQYLARLAANALPGFERQQAQALIDLSIRRELVGIGEDIQSLAFDAPVDETPKMQIEGAIERLSKLSTVGLRDDQRQSTAGAAAESILTGIESDEVVDPPISTGLHDLDRLIGGYRRGALDILAGRPGMGKSTLAGSSALRVAEAGHGVLFFSKEMTKDQLVARLLTDLAYRPTEPVTYDAILNREVREQDKRLMLRDASNRLCSLPFIIDPQPGMTMAEIAMRTRRVAESMERKGIRLGLVIVDHLGKVRSPASSRRENRNVELGDITAAGADLAKDVGACLLMLCQLSRKVEERDNKRPQQADLRESGHIEEDADAILLLYREAYYLSKQTIDDPEKETERLNKLARVAHDLEVIVAKNRHGTDGVARLWTHVGTASVRDRAS